MESSGEALIGRVKDGEELVSALQHHLLDPLPLLVRQVHPRRVVRRNLHAQRGTRLCWLRRMEAQRCVREVHPFRVVRRRLRDNNAHHSVSIA